MSMFCEYEFVSQRQLSQMFDVSPGEMGRWLFQTGMRTAEKEPSKKALDHGMAKHVSIDGGATWFWAWDRLRILKVLEIAGHRRPVSDDAGKRAEAQAEPLPLVGPFELRQEFDQDYALVGTNEACVRVRGKANAENVWAVLNLAHKAGRLAAK